MSDPSQLTGQGVRFVIVGVYNVAFTLAVFWLLDHFWGAVIGVQAVYWTSAVLGVINGFIAQRLFVWRSTGAWHGQLVKFFAMNAAVSAVNSLLLFVTVTLWHLPAFPSQVAITGLLTLTSFFVSRNWVFRGMPTSKEPPHHDD